MVTPIETNPELTRLHLQSASRQPVGWWSPTDEGPTQDPARIASALMDLRKNLILVGNPLNPMLACGGWAVLGRDAGREDALPIVAFSPSLRPEDLGDPTFLKDHGVQYPYVTGAMANGIASVEVVEAASRGGMLGFFGSAGLPLETVARAIDRLQTSLGSSPHGLNLIHSPNEPGLEAQLVDLYLQRGVRRIEASAFMELTPAIVRYRVSGLEATPAGVVAPRNRVVAKISRAEVATRFLSPPPERILAELLARGQISRQEASFAGRIAMADDVTVEADSGGHTDNRPLVALLPSIIALRDRLQAQHRFATPARIGAAGGISTPASAAAAFAMGAAYVVTGSVNQACVESGSSDAVRILLAEAGMADIAMAPAADMFEMGIKVQVLKRGTMFPMRAAKLFDIYRSSSSLETISPPERASLERDLFRRSLEDVWRETHDFFLARDPAQIERAQRDPKHKMALVFRWYLGLSSRWANSGDPTRRLDYQVWCGPAMGAFNEWTRGSFLEQPANRRVAIVARNILHGAAYSLRLSLLRSQGIHLQGVSARAAPLESQELDRYLN